MRRILKLIRTPDRVADSEKKNLKFLDTEARGC